jgi:hypothetical protein
MTDPPGVRNVTWPLDLSTCASNWLVVTVSSVAPSLTVSGVDGRA